MKPWHLMIALGLVVTAPAQAEQVYWDTKRVIDTPQASPAHSLYQLVDMDNSGVMSAKEYAHFKEVHDHYSPDTYLAYSFNGLDQDKDGLLTISEFRAQRVIKAP